MVNQVSEANKGIAPFKIGKRPQNEKSKELNLRQKIKVLATLFFSSFGLIYLFQNPTLPPPTKIEKPLFLNRFFNAALSNLSDFDKKHLGITAFIFAIDILLKPEKPFDLPLSNS